MQRNRERLLLYTILFLSITILILITFFVNAKFKETYANFRKVNQQNLVIEQASDVNVQLMKMGNAARAYLTNKNGSDFILFQQALPRALNQLNDLKNMVSEDAVQLAIADSLSTLFKVKYTIWNNEIVLKGENRSDMDDSLNMEGLKATTSIMNLTQRLKENEVSERENYIAVTEKGIQMATILFLGITLICVTLILFVSYRLYAEIKNGEEVQIELGNIVQELNRSNAELERFAFVASHDLQEPVRKLHAFTGLLAESEKENLSPAGLDTISRIQKFSIRMQTLIDDLLEYSIGFKKVDLKPVDLNITLEEVKQDIMVNIIESKAIIKSDKLPVIMGAESQLRQLIQNIISNSIRYAKAGVPPQIIITAEIVTGDKVPGVSMSARKNQFWKLVFSDNGIGFDNQYADKIFLIFQRLHGKSEYSGTGIGLATCKLVVENHKGYINAFGRPDKGSDFTVFLPIK